MFKIVPIKEDLALQDNIRDNNIENNFTYKYKIVVIIYNNPLK